MAVLRSSSSVIGRSGCRDFGEIRNFMVADRTTIVSPIECSSAWSPTVTVFSSSRSRVVSEGRSEGTVIIFPFPTCGRPWT